MSDILERYQFLDADELMVVPFHATGSSLEGTRRYYWHAVRGRGYCTHGTIVRKAEEAQKLAKELTDENEEF